MKKLVRRPLAVITVSILLVAISAGAALAANVACPGGNCFGTAFDDNIKGSIYVDYIKAYAGNDHVEASYANDTINPGSGNDTVLGWYGNDRIDGAALGGTWTTDDLGNDTLYGEGNNDYIIDWRGNDWVFGGNDNDTLNVRDGYCGDYANGGSGFDTVYADSCDFVTSAEIVYKSAAGAKTSAKQERPTPPDLSKESSNKSESK